MADKTPKRRRGRRSMRMVVPEGPPLRIIEPGMCPSCGKQPADDPHPCPYQEDVKGVDDPEYCTCCSDCVNTCAADI